MIAGPDHFDSTVSKTKVPNFSDQLNVDQNYRVAYIKETLNHPGIQKEVLDHTVSRIESLKAWGHQVEEVEFPLMEYALPTYYILTTAEASSNLSRFDGIKYGASATSEKDLEGLYKRTRTEGFGKEVLRRIMLGTFVLSASYYDCLLYTSDAADD